ncbi:DoxX family protein [Alistipes sp.]|uniref:DoxX family protein n=1 Tax=Alistipes sp. TaxID=1872444 RepID=UPI003AF12F48
MRRRIEAWLEQYRCLDWAVLYMRLFAGAMMLFHNIGKVQSYNEIIDSYPSVFFLSGAGVFIFITVAEVVLAVLIILGLWVRMAALILSLGIFMRLVWGGFGAGENQFVWLGIYVFFILSGGGLYAFDRASCSPRRGNRTKGTSL